MVYWYSNSADLRETNVYPLVAKLWIVLYASTTFVLGFDLPSHFCHQISFSEFGVNGLELEVRKTGFFNVSV